MRLKKKKSGHSEAALEKHADALIMQALNFITNLFVENSIHRTKSSFFILAVAKSLVYELHVHRISVAFACLALCSAGLESCFSKYAISLNSMKSSGNSSANSSRTNLIRWFDEVT